MPRLRTDTQITALCTELVQRRRKCAKVRRRRYPLRVRLPNMAGTFFSGLDQAVVDKIRQAAVPRTYSARSYIFYEGDPGTGVFVVESGLLRIDRTTPRGRIVLLDLALKGALIGELSVIDGERRSATLSTVTECSIRHLPAETFRTMVRDDPAIQSAVMRRLARRLRELSTQFLETSAMDAPARIAARLVRLVDIEQTLGRLELNGNGTIDLKLPISQEELGQWAGLSREGAVKGLSTLRSIGLIETGRKRVVINDLDELQSTARTD